MSTMALELLQYRTRFFMVLLLCFWSFLYLTDVITIVVKELNEDSCDMQLEQNEDELAGFSFFWVNYSFNNHVWVCDKSIGR